MADGKAATIGLVLGLLTVGSAGTAVGIHIANKAERSDLVLLTATVSSLTSDFRDLKNSLGECVKISALYQGTYDRAIRSAAAESASPTSPSPSTVPVLEQARPKAKGAGKKKGS